MPEYLTLWSIPSQLARGRLKVDTLIGLKPALERLIQRDFCSVVCLARLWASGWKGIMQLLKEIGGGIFDDI